MEIPKNLGGDIEKMKTGKKIAVCLAAALAIAIFAAGAVSMVGAQVAEDLDVSIEIDEIDFNVVMLGETAEIARSFTLTNNGPLAVMVQASSTGLFDEAKEIPAECLSIKGVPLSESDTYIATVGAGSTEVFDAVLSLLAYQEPGEYTGIVELTFTADVADEDTEVIEDTEVNVADEDTEVIEDTEVNVADEDTEVTEDTVVDAPEIPLPPEE